MKTLMMILILMTTNAHAQSRPECYEKIKATNKKFSQIELVFAEMQGDVGDWLFVRFAKGHTPTNEEQAAMIDTGRTCIKAGFSNNTGMGQIGNDTPQKLCQITNINAFAMMCSEWKLPTPKIVRLK